MERNETPDPVRSNALDSRFQCVRQEFRQAVGSGPMEPGWRRAGARSTGHAVYAATRSTRPLDDSAGEVQLQLPGLK